MSELEATVLELGQWPVIGLGREAVAFRVVCCSPVVQHGLVTEHQQHLVCIGLPVGRAVEVATRFQACRQPGDQCRLNQAAFVVPLLVPGIGKEDVYAVETARWHCGIPWQQHLVDHFDRIVVDDAQVGQAQFPDTF